MAEKTRRPNFVIFVADQMQSACLGCNGHRQVRTPNIDRIARDGTTFRRAYCNNAVSMPSRSTMITGLTPRQHGCITNGRVLPTHVPTITQALVDAGYRTHAVGKLHLQPFGAQMQKPRLDKPPLSWEARQLWTQGLIRSLPQPYYGFQTSDYVGGHVNYCFGDYANWLEEVEPGAHALYQRKASPTAPPHLGTCWQLAIPESLHYNTWIANRSIRFMEDVEPEEPFFLWCSFPDPHFPFAACAPYSEMYDPAAVDLNPSWDTAEDLCDHLARRRAEQPHNSDFTEEDLRHAVAQTYGMITHMDTCIGRVLDHMAAAGLDENTVVCFMADHGEYLGSHHLLYKGGWPLEPLLRVPLVWRAPGAGEGHGPSDSVVSLLDFAPTVLDYAGIEEGVLDMSGAGEGERPGLPGRSLRRVVDDGVKPPSQAALIEQDEDWHRGVMARARTIVTEAHKLSIFPPHPEGLLCWLTNDPMETINLWDDPSAREVRLELTTQLVSRLAWTDRMDGPRLCGA